MQEKLKSKDNLYFDVWRKAGFKNLLRAYVNTYSRFPKNIIATGFGDNLDRFVEKGRGAYKPDGWGAAYSISRELGVYKENSDGQYELSGLALDYLHSRITGAEYLTNYLLNLNQLINGVVVHPLHEVLKLFADKSSLEIDDIVQILAFSLGHCTELKRSQFATVLCHRMVEAEILTPGSDKKTFPVQIGKYEVDELKKALRLWGSTPVDFEEMGFNGYVEMISFPNALVYGEREMTK